MAIDIPPYNDSDWREPLVGSGRYPPIHLGVYDKVPYRGGIFNSWPFRRENRKEKRDLLNGFKFYEDNWKEAVVPTRFAWKNGEDLVFDDAFPHYVQNFSPYSRAILFADIPRIDVVSPLQWLIRAMYVHALPWTEHWRKDMALQHKGLHKAFGVGMDVDLGEEGFEFHHPEEEAGTLALIWLLPFICAVHLVFFSTRCGPCRKMARRMVWGRRMGEGCEDALKRGIKGGIYAKQA